MILTIKGIIKNVDINPNMDSQHITLLLKDNHDMKLRLPHTELKNMGELLGVDLEITMDIHPIPLSRKIKVGDRVRPTTAKIAGHFGTVTEIGMKNSGTDAEYEYADIALDTGTSLIIPTGRLRLLKEGKEE